MAAYVAYFRTDLCARRFGTNHIRVLTVYEGKTTRAAQSRLQNLKKTTEEAGGTRRYYFSDLSSITTNDVLRDPVWLLAGGTESVPLIFENQRIHSQDSSE